MTKRNKAMQSAWQKGRDAAERGESKTANPYRDVRADYNNSVTFSRAFLRCWDEGYDSLSQK